MNYLIDTHILIWRISSNPQLSQKFIDEIDNPLNSIVISKASLWEIAIKVSLQKLHIGIAFSELEEYLLRKDISILDFTHLDLNQLITLPKHHGDPFDRLIISQAITNNITIITDDKKFKLYSIPLL
ncbi:MAG: type II toxin-antitoxin system VapC family toxin [Cyclobacteriaceae bacterium]